MDKRRFVCDAMDYADKNFGNGLVLGELARISGYSVPQFTRLFTEYTGITPMRYVNITRIINAKQMLTENKKSITNIAFDCGFESLEVFERSFRRYFNMSASEFRKTGNTSAASSFYLSEKIYYERLRRSMMIDGGNSFNWGKTAEIYAKSRDIYPDSFWKELHSLGVGAHGQKILDIGTGTGILPQNMCQFGGDYTGVDLSPEMVDMAEYLPQGTTMQSSYVQMPMMYLLKITVLML